MVTKKISTTDMHLIETDDGNISVKFRVLSHELFVESLGKSNADMVRTVTLGVDGLTLFVDELEVPADKTVEAICADPSLTNWFYDEYQVFWRKKALTKHSKSLPDNGQAAAPPAA